jgi:predicted ATP-grasp superfamily ATP-dependent carboligase
MRILITDADYKHTLAAVRSLGKRRNVEVTASSHVKRSLSFYSKYCKNRVIYSNPADEHAFIRSLLHIIKNGSYDVLLPISFSVCTAIAKYQDKFKHYVKIPIANYESMQIASDKNETIKFAQNNDIPIPKTIYPNSIKDVERISNEIKYPVVIKAPEECGSVKYANSAKELINLYKHTCNSYKSQIAKGKFPQIQEYIQGEGYGFFALFNHGEPRALFAHTRLHEYPPTGGPSTMAQSVYDPALQELGLKILKKLKWHGVAMVEFKRDSKSGEFKLIEINPKFWGSLDLAIASGVDFPYLACKMCVDGDIKPVFEYNKNTIFRWTFPDLVYSLATNSLSGYVFNFFNKDITDDLFLEDIKPTTLQCYTTMFEIASHIKNRNLKYPHGKPEVIL